MKSIILVLAVAYTASACGPSCMEAREGGGWSYIDEVTVLPYADPQSPFAVRSHYPIREVASSPILGDAEVVDNHKFQRGQLADDSSDTKSITSSKSTGSLDSLIKPSEKIKRLANLMQYRAYQREKHDSQFRNTTFMKQVQTRSIVRLMSWNIHEAFMHTVGGKESTWNDIWKDVANNDPDVVLLQEFPASRVDDPLPFELGYDYVSMCSYGIPPRRKKLATYSKFPFLKDVSETVGDRCILHTIIEFQKGELPLTITNVHLSHSFDWLRRRQLLSAKSRGTEWIVESPFHIIGGDYNVNLTVVKSILNTELRGKQRSYWDSHEIVHKVPNHEPTQWRGHTIDFFMVNSHLSSFLKGSYVYHTDSSDHIPIIMDI